MQFIDLKAQYIQIKENIDKRIQKVLDHQHFIMGPEVQELEEKLSSYVGVKHCLGVANGTDALQISMMAIGIKPGDEVITTPFSFIATAETIVLLGAKPVFVDIDPKTYNISPNLIEQAITDKTKAIMPVSLYGQCAEFNKINQIAKKHKLPVIEDGAQSFGATYKGKRSCSLSTIACTSFFPSKPLGAYGDAGACFTDDDEIAKAIREIRVHGQDRRYHHPRIGVNGRLDTLQAAILLAKFDIFPQEVEARSKIGQKYSELLKNTEVITPYIEPYNTSVYAQYTIQTESRDKLQKKLKEKGIPTAVHYPIPLNKQPALEQSMQNPIAETAANKVLSLPIHPFLSEKDMNVIAEVIKSV